MDPDDCDAMANELGRELAGDEGPSRLLEIGIGRRTAVAAALAASGHRVVAVDVVDRPVPGNVTFVRADVRLLAADPTDALPVADVDVVYGLDLPAELQAPTAHLARRLDAACAFTTLGFEEPTRSLPVERRPVGSETVYVVTPAGDGPPFDADA